VQSNAHALRRRRQERRESGDKGRGKQNH
jgi:hypothetical protein